MRLEGLQKREIERVDVNTNSKDTANTYYLIALESSEIND